MKRYRDFLLGALIATLLFASFSVGRASAASSGCFTDTNGHWAESFICWLKDNGISSGYADGSYRPDNSITRGEMAVMLKKVNDVSKGYSDSSLIAAKNYTDASLNNEIQITLSPKE
ncbi:MAG TPA: S-layer homology domain-containing protein [Anaerolineales bacterium]|nr:S-layer homology domain-containing protein [Anaerolineales bacterium]